MAGRADVIIAGCGYIGKLLAAELINQGHYVTGLGSSIASAQQCENLAIPCRQIDFDQVDTLCQAGINSRGKAIIYLAPPPRSGCTDTRIRNFLTAIEQEVPEKFVLISTTGVYGDCAGDWVDEQTPINPAVDRALRRADAETQADDFCARHNIPLVILRVPGIYGPGKLPLARIEKGVPVVRAWSPSAK